MELEMVAHHSIAKELDDNLMEVRCVNCHRFLTVTIHEIRTEKVVPCPNCEAWIPLWDIEGIFQGLYEKAKAVDDALAAACH